MREDWDEVKAFENCKTGKDLLLFFKKLQEKYPDQVAEVVEPKISIKKEESRS